MIAGRLLGRKREDASSEVHTAYGRNPLFTNSQILQIGSAGYSGCICRE